MSYLNTNPGNEPEDAGLREALPKSLETQWQLAAASLRKNLMEVDKAPWAWSLTDLDLAAVALSALSDETNYMVAPPPIPAKESSLPQAREALAQRMITPDLLLVEAKNNNLFFYHVLNAAMMRGMVRKEQIPAVLETGFVSVDEKAYPEYLDIHQHAVRAMYANQERYRPDAVLLLSAMNALYFEKGTLGIFGAARPMLDIVGHDANGLNYVMMSRPFQQRLAPGSRVLIPGAGYNSLLNLTALIEAAPFEFILNDHDPFVAPIMERVISYVNAPHISFVSGDMRSLTFEPRSVDFALLSQLYSVSPESAGGFISALSNALKPGSPVALMQPVRVDNPNHTSLHEWRRLLSDHSFTIELDHRECAPSAALLPGNDQAKTRAMDSTELMKALRTMNTGTEEVIEFGFIIARFPL